VVQEEINYAVFGLGNPGKEYLTSRHNIGFWVVDYLEKQYKTSQKRIECFAVTWLAALPPAQHVLFVKPATFMNLSGKAVGQIVQKYALPLNRILILHDDLDLPFLQIRIKNRGQSGGHRGVESIIQSLHTDLFARLKIGIGRPGMYEDPVEYVLSSFSKKEQQEIINRMPDLRDAVESWLESGFHHTANRFNRKNTVDDE